MILKSVVIINFQWSKENYNAFFKPKPFFIKHNIKVYDRLKATIKVRYLSAVNIEGRDSIILKDWSQGVSKQKGFVLNKSCSWWV